MREERDNIIKIFFRALPRRGVAGLSAVSTPRRGMPLQSLTQIPFGEMSSVFTKDRGALS